MAKKFVYNNINYRSLRELSIKLNISYNTLYNRLYKQNMSIEDAINIPMKYGKSKPIIYDGVKYKSMRALAKSYNIRYTTLHQRVHINNQSLRDSINNRVRKCNRSNKPMRSREYEYLGKLYKLTELSKKFNMTYSTLYSRIVTRGMSIDDAVNNKLCPAQDVK